MSIRSRRFAAGVAAAALALGTAAISAVPAQAIAYGQATNASIDVTRWYVGTSVDATVSWTNSTNSITSVMVRSPWPWDAAFPAGTVASPSTSAATGGTVSGPAVQQTITCASVNAVFTISSASLSGQPTCNSVNVSGSWKGFYINGGGLNVSAGATISVAIGAGMVTAPSTPRTDGWLVGVYDANYVSATQAEITTVAYADAAPFDWSKAMLPEGQLSLVINDALTEAICTAPTFSKPVTKYQFAFTIGGSADEVTTPFGTLQSGTTSTAKVALTPAVEGTHLKCTLTAFGDGAVSTVSATKKVGDGRLASAPLNVTATPIREGVTVTWQAPAVSGASVSNYLAQATPGGRVCITRKADANMLSCTFKGLTAGTKFDFTVQALTPLGWGSKSAVVPATPFDVRVSSSSRSTFLLIETMKLGLKAPGYADGTVVTVEWRTTGGSWATAGTTKVSNGAAGFKKTLPLKWKKSGVEVQLKIGAETSRSATVAPLK